MKEIYDRNGNLVSAYNTNDLDLAVTLAERADKMEDPVVVPARENWQLAIIDKLHEAGYWIIDGEDELELYIAKSGVISNNPLIFENWSDVEYWLEEEV